MSYAAVDEGEGRDFHVHDYRVVLACPARGPSEGCVAPVVRGARIRRGTAGDEICPRYDNHVGMEVVPVVGKMTNVIVSVRPS